MMLCSRKRISVLYTWAMIRIKINTMEKSSILSYFKALIVLVSLIVLLCNQVDASCTKLREGFRCVATEQDTLESFKVTMTNIRSDMDIRLDIFRKVDDCRNRRQGIPLNQSLLNNLPPSSGTSSSNIRRTQLDGPLEGTYDRDVVVPKRGNLSINLDRISSTNYCSHAVIRNCRTPSNEVVDCATVLRVK